MSRCFIKKFLLAPSTGRANLEEKHQTVLVADGGATITYRFQGLTGSGKPRFPVFLRVRVRGGGGGGGGDKVE